MTTYINDANKDPSKKVFVLVAYTGHGLIDSDNKTCMYFRANAEYNEEYPNEKHIGVFNLEKTICRWAKCYRNNYIMAVFDCCREKI